jgi:hypothetical protein
MHEDVFVLRAARAFEATPRAAARGVAHHGDTLSGAQRTIVIDAVDVKV